MTAPTPHAALVVVDLDGTLVKGNTMHIFLRCGMRELVHSRRWAPLCRLGWHLGLRALRLTSHLKMKFAVLPLVPLTPELKDDFTSRVRAAMNPQVQALLHRLTDTNPMCDVLLATAAPDFYIPWIWDGPFVATHGTDNPDRIECRGMNKLRRVMAYAKTHHLPLEVAITDHIDDLPLLTASAQRYIVNPSPETVKTLQRNSLPFAEI